MIEHHSDVTEIDVSKATVTTVLPGENGDKFREYNVPADELRFFLASMRDPVHAERIMNVEIERESTLRRDTNE